MTFTLLRAVQEWSLKHPRNGNVWFVVSYDGWKNSADECQHVRHLAQTAFFHPTFRAACLYARLLIRSTALFDADGALVRALWVCNASLEPTEMGYRKGHRKIGSAVHVKRIEATERQVVLMTARELIEDTE